MLKLYLECRTLKSSIIFCSVWAFPLEMLVPFYNFFSLSAPPLQHHPFFPDLSGSSWPLISPRLRSVSALAPNSPQGCLWACCRHHCRRDPWRANSFLAVRGRRCLPENPWEHFLCSHSRDLWWITQVRGLLVQGCGSRDLQGVPHPVAMLQFVGACNEALQWNNRCCQACWKKREKLLMCRVKSRGVWGMWKERRVREPRTEWKEHGGLKQRHRKRSQAWWKGRLG